MKEKMKKQALRVLNWHIDAYNAGLKGRLKLIGIWFAVAMVLVAALGEPMTRVEMSSSEAVIHKTVSSWQPLGSVTTNILGEVYELARSNPELKHVRVSLTMSKSGLIDEYGNPAKEDIHMGDLEWNDEDLEEARQYQERSLYSVHEIRNALYRHHIQGMRAGHLLKQ